MQKDLAIPFHTNPKNKQLIYKVLCFTRTNVLSTIDCPSKQKPEPNIVVRYQKFCLRSASG